MDTTKAPDIPSRRTSGPHAARHRTLRRSGILGVIAGTIGIGCCVAPVALVLLGISTAGSATALGNRLYAEWGWAFKGAAVLFAVVALLIQRRRSISCTAGAAGANLRRSALWLGGSALATYTALYLVTTALGKAAI